MADQRLFISGLAPSITDKDLEQRFKTFGKISDVKLHSKTDFEGKPMDSSAHLTLHCDEKVLKKCLGLFNGAKWKGKVMTIERAKESFFQRANREREEMIDAEAPSVEAEAIDPAAIAPINIKMKEPRTQKRKLDVPKEAPAKKAKKEISFLFAMGISQFFFLLFFVCFMFSLTVFYVAVIAEPVKVEEPQLKVISFESESEEGEEDEEEEEYVPKPLSSWLESSESEEDEEEIKREELRRARIKDKEERRALAKKEKEETEKKEKEEKLILVKKVVAEPPVKPKVSANKIIPAPSKVTTKMNENEAKKLSLNQKEFITGKVTDQGIIANEFIGETQEKVTALSDNDSDSDDIFDMLASGQKSKVVEMAGEHLKKTKVGPKKMEKMKIPPVKVIEENEEESEEDEEKKALKKQKVEAEQRRLASVQERNEMFQMQKSIVAKALTASKSGKSAQKIVFNSDSEDDEPTQKKKKKSPIVAAPEFVPEKKGWDLFESEEEDEEEGDKEGTEEEEEEDGDMFRLREHYEGKAGKKLLDLQERYGDDDRFKLDDKFLESASEDEEEEERVPRTVTEKDRALGILNTLDIKHKKKTKVLNFKDAGLLRYDPSNKEHAKFELEDKVKVKKNKVKKKKETSEESDKREDEMPEVSKERFAQVKGSLKDLFNKSDKPFSLLGTFSSANDQPQKDTSVEAVPMPSSNLGSRLMNIAWGGEQKNFFVNNNEDDDDSEKKDKSADEPLETENLFVPRKKSGFFFSSLNESKTKEQIQSNIDGDLEKLTGDRKQLTQDWIAKRKRHLRMERRSGWKNKKHWMAAKKLKK
ncbi:hypothetical protein CAPTEDRAFT_228664 [Capitella teleta]|uniref:RRM domain-containing protein n=1 Tax=Capitella teleta TaxID=283909 RepID=R7V043_CAPTE|nr:hypothetical protein CAPTEDRAFT_228664 [Capitella teleta]|eukprot:ELU11929.1 hypothetical protein CAPTEDRAFT_228664 [Capitella teleta]